MEDERDSLSGNFPVGSSGAVNWREGGPGGGGGVRAVPYSDCRCVKLLMTSGMEPEMP